MVEKRIISPREYPWDPLYSERPYSLGVERHGLLCVSGLTAEEYDPGRGSYIIKSASLVAQTRVIFAKLGAILEAAGYSFQDVVYTVDYALEASMPEYRASGPVRREAFGDSMPASVGVLVEGIPNSAALWAVSAVAMEGGRHKRAVFPEGTPTWERYKSRTFWPGFFVGQDWFWLSGSTGRDYDPVTKKEEYSQGIQAQAQAIWSSALGQVMKDASVDPSTVARTFDYVHSAGLELYNNTYDTRAQALGRNEVASSGLVIHRLLHREALLEIDATCYLGNDREAIAVPGWSQGPHPAAVRCGKYLFCSALGPLDYGTGAVFGEGDFEAQVSKTYGNLLRVLKASGASPEDVVKTQEIISPQVFYHQELLDRARRQALGPDLPAVTVVTANQMITPGTDFALEAWAVLE